MRGCVVKGSNLLLRLEQHVGKSHKGGVGCDAETLLTSIDSTHCLPRLSLWGGGGGGGGVATDAAQPAEE